jgi:hypothetical protein
MPWAASWDEHFQVVALFVILGDLFLLHTLSRNGTCTCAARTADYEVLIYTLEVPSTKFVHLVNFEPVHV